MNINSFLYNHLDSMSRTNKFEVEIHGPAGRGLDSQAIRCTDVTMPPITIGTKQHKVLSSGPNSHYITDVGYGDSVELKFILDNTFEDRRLMERWQSLMYDEVWNLSYPEEYHGSVIITQLANDGKPSYEVKLHKAFPFSIGAIPYNAGEGGIQTFTVGFKFRTWSTSYENTGLPGKLAVLFGKDKATKPQRDKIGREIPSMSDGDAKGRMKL